MMSEGSKPEDLFPWEESPAEDAGPTRAGEPRTEPDDPDDLHAAAVDTPAIDEPEEAAESVDAAELPDVDFDLPPLLSNERPVAQKEYYSISEVCDLVDLKPHVLRYWETQFQVLNPSKNRSGNRVYQRKEIKLILLVKHLLYEEKYTVEGARTKLDRIRRGGDLPDRTTQALDRELMDALRDDLRTLMKILSPPRPS
jgi:DNA-binding transcriptional MerR regulator